MAILFSGDFHANSQRELSKISPRAAGSNQRFRGVLHPRFPMNKLLLAVCGKYAKKFTDKVGLLNDTIAGGVTRRQWFCGH
jgi:hypothetical protein